MYVTTVVLRRVRLVTFSMILANCANVVFALSCSSKTTLPPRLQPRTPTTLSESFSQVYLSGKIWRLTTYTGSVVSWSCQPVTLSSPFGSRMPSDCRLAICCAAECLSELFSFLLPVYEASFCALAAPPDTTMRRPCACLAMACSMVTRLECFSFFRYEP